MTTKQGDSKLYEEIQTDGCLFMSLLDIACADTYRDLRPEDVNRLYKYVTPWWMRDGGHVKADRCYVLEHEPIIRAAFDFFGHHDMQIVYRYRRDGDEQIMGVEKDLNVCNYWITKIRLPGFSHFYRSRRDGEPVYNPGVSMSHDIMSVRGYSIWT